MMANPSGRKGSAYESALAAYARANGFPDCERRARNGVKDRGDLTGIHAVVVEAKAEKRIDLPRYLREAEIERINDSAYLGLVCVKRRNASIGQGYFVVTVETGFRILRTLVLGEPWQ